MGQQGNFSNIYQFWLPMQNSQCSRTLCSDSVLFFLHSLQPSPGSSITSLRPSPEPGTRLQKLSFLVVKPGLDKRLAALH
ncbi:MAG: hypothetical protein DDT26_01627 [Dehalococcoidia bacterium]|nr:hypothetical protein [Chloroflexota bacterium]